MMGGMATPAEETSPRQWIHDLMEESGKPLSESELVVMAQKLLCRERELTDWAVKEALAKRRLPKIHILKAWLEQFQAILDGTKTFEYRKDDRGFGVGDLLQLREFNEAVGPYGKFTGREIAVSVTYIARSHFGIPDGYCVMSVEHASDLRAVRPGLALA